jgi:hypothetical protein
VERQPDLVDPADRQRFGDLGQEGIGDRPPVLIGADFRENHADGRAFLVPPLDVCVAAGTGEREQHFFERLVVAMGFQKPRGVQEHQHKAPAGPFGPFSLEIQRAGEKLLGEDITRLQRDTGLGGVRISVTPR